MLYLLLSVYICMSTLGLVGMKTAGSFFAAKFIGSALLYLLAACMWVSILRSFPLSLAFPIASSGIIVATSIVGALYLHEEQSVSRLAGLVLMIVGIILVSQVKQ